MKGKDGRELSYHQSKEWMQKIAKNRSYRNVTKGEKSGRVKLTEAKVKWIRSLPYVRRQRAYFISQRFGICPSYVYHLRARYRWKHI